jgi:hypothetical protein
LHREAAVICGLSFGEEGPVVKCKACRLFRHVDVDGGARKQSGRDECELSPEHSFHSFDPPTSLFVAFCALSGNRSEA